MILCDLLDIFRSAISKNGLFQSSKVLFVVELFSLPLAASVIIFIWKYPALILSERAAAREIDFNVRRERPRLGYLVPPPETPEERQAR